MNSYSPNYRFKLLLECPVCIWPYQRIPLNLSSTRQLFKSFYVISLYSFFFFPPPSPLFFYKDWKDGLDIFTWIVMNYYQQSVDSLDSSTHIREKIFLQPDVYKDTRRHTCLLFSYFLVLVCWIWSFYLYSVICGQPQFWHWIYFQINCPY